MITLAKRLDLIRYTICFGWLLGITLSFPLWVPENTYLQVPVLTSLSDQPSHLLILCLLLGIFLFACKKFSSTGGLLITLAIAFFFLFDQARMHAWVYLYSFITLAFVVLSSNHSSKQLLLLSTLQLIIFATYFYSGLQKLNSGFAQKIMPWMVEPFIEIFPKLEGLTPSLAVMTPISEIVLAILLLSSKTRIIAVIGLIMMHLFILYALGPLGHMWNISVWPWNVVMILLLILLFWKLQVSNAVDILIPKHSLMHKLVFIFFIIAPIFSFFGKWDLYPSFALYSGNTPRAYIYFNAVIKEHLPQEVQIFAKKTKPKNYRINLNAWSVQTTSVPLYPAKRVYYAIFNKICNFVPDDQKATLEITDFLNNRLTSKNC